jgi:hypothetical protein
MIINNVSYLKVVGEVYLGVAMKEVTMPETKYCGQCGHANPATHKFCTSCGLKISGAPAPRPPADRSSAPPKYEYHSETVRGGIFFTDSKVNKRVA